MDGQFQTDLPLEGEFRTWNYSRLLENHDNIKYAKLYCGGKDIEEICPTLLGVKWKMVSRKINAFYASLRESKVSVKNVCVSDIIPEKWLKEFSSVKNEITQYVFETYKEPNNHEFLVDLTRLVVDIEKRKLNLIDNSFKSDRISYDIFGTRTGRMTTSENSFPILTLPKTERSKICPTNDLFFALDFNAAEIRALNVLLGKKSPQVDLHEWNAKNILKRDVDRDTIKKDFFAWLYNPNSKNKELEKYYDREKVLKEYFKSNRVINPFGREIESDRFHALSYLVQSTLTDIFLRQAIKVYKYLKEQNANSFISSLIHDNLVLDVDKREKELIKKCIDIFSNTDYDVFKCSVSVGKNFGEMKGLL
ncbi:MAG: hypothetical protein Q8P81_02090 [Nanoarchaeota archaeon]|nr:hypothetical protein [Nanoarchaeota archaeon]